MTKCPPGLICLNKNFIIITILLVIGLIALASFQNQQNDLFSVKKNKDNNMDNYYYLDNDNNNNNLDLSLKKNIEIDRPPPCSTSLETLNQSKIIPDSQPIFYTQPLSNIPPVRQTVQNINIPTRGYVPEFKQIGILHSKNKKFNSKNLILPLYGKPLYPGSSKWQYYSQTESYNSIKINIKFKGKDCLNDHGCEEINDGDTVRIPAYAQPFKVNLYNIDKPTYIPYIV